MCCEFILDNSGALERNKLYFATQVQLRMTLVPLFSWTSSLLHRSCSTCPWSSQGACRDLGTSPWNRWVYRTVWRWNWSLFARVTAGRLPKQTAASASRAKGLSSAACVCASRASWERSASAMRKALCWATASPTMSRRYAAARVSATADSVRVTHPASDASTDLTASVTITPVFAPTGSSAEVGNYACPIYARAPGVDPVANCFTDFYVL